ncbi:MAG: hypothetical protein A3E87_09175 [Gammaproteobacteria bacterium RIFCSPHIGHO2_12_FULL_35_23]|nr:MAG: hypothetical protein A3E87_09175 [Gammaproteobacteria bacterium RIFCSPHIGHO2_12_FULL_35_23]
MTLYTATITLVLIMDPIGNIPVFASLLKNFTAKRRTQIILRETFFALIILLIFLFAGKTILRSLQISTPALSAGGGIILFLIALKMIFPDEAEEEAHRVHQEPFIVPLAIPLIAGPSTMATIMLFVSRESSKEMKWLLALIIAWLISTVILLLGNQLSKILRERGLIALERLMGMILMTLAVQMFLAGIESFFKLPM